MKRDVWKRLVELARLAPEQDALEMPFGFETRVIAAWRNQEGTDEPLPLSAMLGGAVLCSLTIMLLSIALNYTSLTSGDSPGVSIADSALRITMLP